MSFSLPSARAWHGHEVVDLAVGRLALHYAEENPDEVAVSRRDLRTLTLEQVWHQNIQTGEGADGLLLRPGLAAALKEPRSARCALIVWKLNRR